MDPKGPTPGRSARRKGWTDQQSVFWYRVCRVLIHVLMQYWIGGFRAIGAENVPASGGAFLVANHTTGLDPFIIGYRVKHRMLWGPGKIELFQNRIVAYFMRKLGIFPLRQEVADAAAVRTMVSLYRAGQVIAVYPEGGRSRSGEMRPFTPDFARLMIRLKAPLIPAGVAGGREALPMGSLIPRRHSPITVVYGPAFDLSEFYDQVVTPEVAKQASRMVEDRVAKQVALAREERARLLEKR